MKTRVLLVVPNHYHYAEYHWIPGNMVFLASTLRARGYRPRIIDDRVLTREQTFNEIAGEIDETVAVMISTSSGRQLYNALRIAQFVKSNYEVPVVFGGPHPTAEPEITMTEPNIDFVVVGQGEYVVCALCDHIVSSTANTGIEEIPNLFYRDREGGVRKTKARPDRIDIAKMPELPYFDKDVLLMERYINPETRAINYSTSVGCVGRCSFCYWHEDYRYSVFNNQRVIADLKRFKELYDIRNVNFDDPTFFVEQERTMELVRMLIEAGLNVKWRANGRVDLLRNYGREDFEKVRESGCYLIHVGLESASPRVLKLMNKRIDPEDTLRILKMSMATGVRLRFHLLFGIPTEEISDLRTTGELLARLLDIDPDLDYTYGFFTPFPGNRLTRLAGEFGYRPPRTLEEFTRLHVYLYKDLPDDDRVIVKETCAWEEDMEIPWFTESFREEYMKAFREVIPRKDEIMTTDEKTLKIFERIPQ
jgi:anaerobic magnesium-protoporphyrin IX monomethyl ester cyclase